uniref:hypothetical protein n=1 Tax=Nocardia suismassiliense TaxID=2077092 RepID=UPI003F49B18A
MTIIAGRPLMNAPVLDPVSLIVEARTTEQFLDGLRAVQVASGRNSSQIAKYAGLPRSTAYHVVSPKKHGLPRKAETLEKFCRGCKLTPEQIKQVMNAWSRLGGGAAVSTTPSKAGRLASGSGPERVDVPVSDEVLERMLDDTPGPPVTIGGSVRDVHITYNIAPESPDPLTRLSRRPRQLGSVALLAATVVTIAVIIDLVTDNPHLTRIGSAAWQAPLSQTVLCAVVLVWMSLGVLRRIGRRERRRALARLRYWPALGITTITAVAASAAVGSAGANPIAAAAVGSMTWLVVALWFASNDLGELRQVFSHCPALVTLGVLGGAAASVGVWSHELPLAPALLAGALTAFAMLHFIGKVAAPLMDVARAPAPSAAIPLEQFIAPVEQPVEQLIGESPEASTPQPICEPWDTLSSLDIQPFGSSEPDEDGFLNDCLTTEVLPVMRRGVSTAMPPVDRRDVETEQTRPTRRARRRANRRRHRIANKGRELKARAQRAGTRLRARLRPERSELPPLPRRIPWAHPLEELEGISLRSGLGVDDGADVGLPCPDCEHQESAYDIITRIGRERAQAAGRAPRGTRTGTRVGPYRIQALLSRNSIGEIYEAYDETESRVVALNLLTKRLGNDPDFLARFNRDVLAASLLPDPAHRDHPRLGCPRWHPVRRHRPDPRHQPA